MPAWQKRQRWMQPRAISIVIRSCVVSTNGTGGRTDWTGTQNDYGDAWDHFAVTYWYPDNVHASFSSHQLNGSLSDLCVRVFGVHGCADTHYGGLVRITGRNAWLGGLRMVAIGGGAGAVTWFIGSLLGAAVG